MPDSEQITHCMGCGTSLRGHQYCGQCGQRNVHRRLAWQAITEDLKAQLLEWDLPWLYTIKELTIRPGKSIREYIEGNRVKYVNPMKYVLYVVAFGTILIAILPDNVLMSSLIFLNSEAQNPLAKGAIANPAIFLLVASPLAVILLRVALWSSKLNRTEMYCFVLYVMGHAALIVYFILIIAAIWYTAFPIHVPSDGLTPIAFTPFFNLAALSFIFLPPVYAAYASIGVFGVRAFWSAIATFLVTVTFIFVSFVLFAFVASQ